MAGCNELFLAAVVGSQLAPVTPAGPFSVTLQVPPSMPFEVYDPHLDAWFSAAPPLPGAGVSLSNHALVANQQEGLLITLGGCLTRCETACIAGASNWQHCQQAPQHCMTPSCWIALSCKGAGCIVCIAHMLKPGKLQGSQHIWGGGPRELGPRFSA